MDFLHTKSVVALLIASFSTAIAHGNSFEQSSDDFDGPLLDDLDEEMISYDEQQNTPSLSGSSQNMGHTKFQEGCWPFENKGWTASSAFLYWKIDQSLTDFAFAKDFPVYQASSPADCPIDGLAGKEHRATFDWEPGFRLDLGYEFNATQWILNGEYTWYHSSHSNSAKTPKNKGDQTCTALGLTPFSILVQTWAGFLNFTPDEAKSNIDFHYNVANLTFEKRISIGSNFNLIPYFGIQGAWIEEDWKVKYTSPFVSTFSNDLHIKYDWDFKGAGIVVGFASEYCLGMGFSFYGDIAFASMYGSYHASHSAKSKPALYEIFEKTSPSDHRTIQNTDIQAGVAWSRNFTNVALRFFAGWEFNTWFNLAEFYRFNDARIDNWDRSQVLMLVVPDKNS